MDMESLRATLPEVSSAVFAVEGHPSNDHAPVRDTTYYKADGDLVVLVEETLFKVHKHLLARDSSVLDIFRLPGEPTPEGSNDSRPFRLSGDTADEFRALLWTLYALPLEIHEQSTTNDREIERLLSLLKIANKYNYVKTGLWAIELVHKRALNRRSPPLSTFDMSRILDAAVECEAWPTRDAVVGIWVAMVKARGTDSTVPLGAIIAGEKHKIRELESAGYYNLLAVLDSAPGPFGVNRDIHTSVLRGLRPEQQLRLYVGYWSLTRYWARLLDEPPLSHCSLCKDRWRNTASLSRVQDCPLWDVLKKVNFTKQCLPVSVCSPGSFFDNNNLNLFERNLEARLLDDFFTSPA